MFEEFDHFFNEYTSSKQRNREKKFLKEKNFVPDKDNPKTGTIDSTEIDPKTNKPKRVRFSFDNENNVHDAYARGDDYVHMNENELKKHPDISKSTFAHEDGHLIYNRNREKFMDEAEKIAKQINDSELKDLMNDHGNLIDEYIADKNSLDKVGYAQTVRMLKHVMNDHLPKSYNQQRKLINKDPYEYIVSRAKEMDLQKLPKNGLVMIGFMKTDDMYKRSIKSAQEMIKARISLKQRVIRDGMYDEEFGNWINKSIQQFKTDIKEYEAKIAENNNERRRLHEKLVNDIKADNKDEAKLKKELLDGVDALEKQNKVELEFRIKMLSFWDKDKSISESFIDDDDTSGTSDFDTRTDNDPDDCYCEESIPTSGDFSQYAQYADLDAARGPIQSIHMRPATQADTENMYNWEIESIHPDLQTKPNVQELIRKDVQESIKDTQMIMDGDKTIGMFTACMIDDGEWRYIGEIYLIPEYRGRGIGTSILKNEIDNFDKIRLQVATTNTGAIKLYESLGFKIVKEVDGQMYVMEYDATKETVQEAKLPAKKRNKLDDSDFALVYTDEYGEKVRKYPVHDEAHVRAAARMFPRGVPLKYRKQTASKILRRAHEYNIDTSGWNSINHAAGKD